MYNLPTRRRWLPALLLVALLAACDTVVVPATPSQSTRPSSAPDGAPANAPAPSPTALPAPDLLARAIRARDNGDYDSAALDLRALLDAHPDALEVRAAQFYLAESYGERGRWTSALELLRAF
jgi:soluble lytic murein transglycosylase